MNTALVRVLAEAAEDERPYRERQGYRPASGKHHPGTTTGVAALRCGEVLLIVDRVVQMGAVSPLLEDVAADQGQVPR
ncbi:hypothetical protein AB0O91_28200 [Kitasatospora sp. NPDC089797]|uniref:hypothetical protein n=1 Tax=Kitasatospora sp. NPDC089797 TaxID=3155298 RepID=UPI0034448C11